MKTFKGQDFFKRAAINIFVSQIDQASMQKLSEQFRAIDKDKTGMIDKEEIRSYISKLNIKVTDKELTGIISELDYYGTGKINYTEFIAATVDTHEFLDESKLRSVFSLFDTDATGSISEENLFFAFKKLDLEISRKEISEMMERYDVSKSGNITFDEFKEIFKD